MLVKPRICFSTMKISILQTRITHVNFRLTSSSVAQDLWYVEISALDLLPVISSASDHTVSSEGGVVRTGLQRMASHFMFLCGEDVLRVVGKQKPRIPQCRKPYSLNC